MVFATYPPGFDRLGASPPWRRTLRHWGSLLLVLFLTRFAPAEDLWTARGNLDQKYRQQLETLADQCQQSGEQETAERVSAWARPRDPHKLYLLLSPPATAADSAPPPSAGGALRFHELRHTQAEQLFSLAQRAIRQGNVSLAYELVLQTARENPDHAPARKLLGYQRQRNSWVTPYEISRARQGLVWHEKFGWLKKNFVHRYERGERFFAGRWVSAEQEAAQRSDLTQGWQVESEHYLVTTNHSLEAGVTLSQELERLYRAWQQAFARYYTSQDQLAALLEGRADRRQRGANRFQVVYFRSLAEYAETLSPKVGQDLSSTAGIYIPTDRCAYFYPRDNDDHSTLYHEATHQLFGETREVLPAAGAESNFWVLEGIACYMESLRREDDYDTLGGFDSIRLQDAQARLLRTHYYVPLADFCALGSGMLQQHPDIARLYTQAAGLTHFLMHGDGGRYRDALLEYLVAVYTGENRPDLLADITGLSLAELDQRYAAYLREGPP